MYRMRESKTKLELFYWFLWWFLSYCLALYVNTYLNSLLHTAVLSKVVLRTRKTYASMSKVIMGNGGFMVA